MRVLKRSSASLAAPLRQAQAAALRDIVEACDAQRRQMVTPITGQALVYQEKERQAHAYLALPNRPDPADEETQLEFGFLFGEIGITAPTVEAVAQSIVAAAQQLRRTGPAAERLRLSAKADVMAARTIAEVDEVLQGFQRAMEQLGP